MVGFANVLWEAADACRTRLLGIVLVVFGAKDVVDAIRDLIEVVEGAGELGRPTGLRKEVVEGVDRDGPATALEGRAVVADPAGLAFSTGGYFVGDRGLAVALGNADAAVEAVVRVVRTEPTEAADDPGCCAGRVMSGRGGPRISTACLVEGVGLAVSLARAEPMVTLVPVRAAVGLLALALPDTGAVAGPETDRADRALVTETVEAELLRRSLRRPGASDW